MRVRAVTLMAAGRTLASAISYLPSPTTLFVIFSHCRGTVSFHIEKFFHCLRLESPLPPHDGGGAAVMKTGLAPPNVLPYYFSLLPIWRLPACLFPQGIHSSDISPTDFEMGTHWRVTSIDLRSHILGWGTPKGNHYCKAILTLFSPFSAESPVPSPSCLTGAF